MKTLTLVSIIVFLTLSCASARLGDTIQLCQQRYGAPFKTTNDYVYFKKSGFIIMVTLFEGKVDSITYRKLEENALGKGVDVSDNETEQLLKVNGGERKWKKRNVISMDREWQTEDGEMIAFYKKFDNYLSVGTKGFYERAAAAQKAKENKALEGF